MYFAFIVVTTAGAIAALTAAALTAVLIVKRLSTLRRGTDTDTGSPQHADKNSVPASGVEQKAHENLEEMEQGLHEELDEQGQQTHEELNPKEEGTKKELEEKERSSRWDVHGKGQPS